MRDYFECQRLLITCQTACEHHQKLIRNLVSVLANKILILNDKITHVGKRTTRDKLLSYLSAESIRHSSLAFDIPLTGSWRTIFVLIGKCLQRYQSYKRRIYKTNRNHFELTVSDDMDSRTKRDKYHDRINLRNIIMCKRRKI